jgi:hypothetical protein
VRRGLRWKLLVKSGLGEERQMETKTDLFDDFDLVKENGFIVMKFLDDNREVYHKKGMTQDTAKLLVCALFKLGVFDSRDILDQERVTCRPGVCNP